MQRHKNKILEKFSEHNILSGKNIEIKRRSTSEKFGNAMGECTIRKTGRFVNLEGLAVVKLCTDHFERKVRIPGSNCSGKIQDKKRNLQVNLHMNRTGRTDVLRNQNRDVVVFNPVDKSISQ